MESYSTHGLPASRKVAFWNQISSDTFAAMEVAPRDTLAFDGLLHRAPAGALTLMDVQSAAVHIRHTRAHIARAADASLLLLAPLHRALQLSVDRGPAVTVAAGEFCLIDHARPYEIVHGDGVRTLCVDVPRRLFDAAGLDGDRLAGRLMRADEACARLLLGLLRGIGAEIYPGSTARFAPELAHGLWQLILAAYAPAGDVPSRAVVAARERALRADIDANLADPELRPAAVAARCGLSERYLRALLRAGGESFSEYVLRRRLELAAQRLTDPAWRARTVTAIAFQAGFSDATHFGRAFKARFGRAPRDYRRDLRG